MERRNYYTTMLVLALLGSAVFAADTIKMRDIRDTGPVLPQSPITLKFKNYSWCLKERRSILEADDLPEASIQDSLKLVPKGGELYVQIPTSSIPTGADRLMIFRVKDRRGALLLQAENMLSKAVQADQEGLSDLIILSLPSFPKGDLSVEIEDTGVHQTIEYSLQTGNK